MKTNITASTSKKRCKLLDAIKDRLSLLSDNLLLHILSFLPTTEEVIRTSLLSTRWKYIWISIPNLYFPFSNIYAGRGDGDRKNALVDKVFSLHDSSNIQKFHLDLDDCYLCSSRLEAWISTLTKHRLEEFNLHCRFYRGTLSFPISLFKSLTILKVTITSFLPVPSSICFPNLKALKFGLVRFSVELSTHQHVSFTFPLLEDFEMWNCAWLEVKTVSIYAPSLVKLKVVEAEIGSHPKIDIDAPSLVTLSFGEYLFHHGYPDNGSRIHLPVNLCTAAVSNVKYLTLCDYHIKTFYDTGYLTNTEMFSNVISLRVFSPYYAYSGEHLINLLDCMPNVEYLDIVLDSELSDGDQWSNNRGWMKEQRPHCSLSKLKSVEIHGFDGSENVLYLVSYLLARTLEKMTIQCAEDYVDVCKSKNDISKCLLGLPRGSPGTKVIIRDDRFFGSLH